MKKSKILLALMGLAFLTLLTGCGPVQSTLSTQQLPVQHYAGPTITVTDSIGRKVQVPQKVQRIGCLYSFSGYVTTMLGRSSDIVAVVNGLKRDVLMRKIDPQITQAAVPVLAGKINLEELIKAKPDVVFIQNETYQDQGQMAKLTKTGIPYLVVDYRNVQEQQQAIAVIGQALGESAKAQRFIQYYQSCIDRIQPVVAHIPPEQRIRVYHSINEATRTDTKDSLPADWLQMAGVIDVSVHDQLKLIENKYFASLEQILLWNPQVILVNEDGVADYILQNDQWSALSAVQNKRVYQIPEGISRWGHPGGIETPLAILWTAKTLYPDKFQQLNLKQETQQFYQEFFGYQLSDELTAKILSGRGMRLNKN